MMPLSPSTPDDPAVAEQGFDEARTSFDYDDLLAIAAPLHMSQPVATSATPTLAWSAEPLARSLWRRLSGLLPFGGLCLVCWALDLPLSIVLSALIIPVLIFRLCVLSVPLPQQDPASDQTDETLPVYSVLVALYREPDIIDQLLAGLSRLDYPPDKREVLFLLEVDDAETRHALLARWLPAGFRLVMVPDGQPRTKPRALNYGLSQARGSLLVVYDAEDRPHHDQLRLAAHEFSKADARLACLQAHLVIANAGAHWLARFFAFEYALQFDALIPRLGLGGWPVTLGGTANHFRRSCLEQAGGWDAWNVTEDADLGIRFARLGMGVRHLASDTLEDAPDRLVDWFMQRRRWIKGWLMTAIVHLRDPLAMARQIGTIRTLLIAIQSLGLVLSVLFWPLTVMSVPWLVINGPSAAPLWLLVLLPIAITIPAILVPLLLGGARRGLGPAWRDLVLLPCYFLLVSAAGWMAVYEFITRPAVWNKTPHRPSA
jgi:cellulose synthase/poly-beta-1,6-N-acetylglucosamine synthase-like glycosyltransferase